MSELIEALRPTFKRIAEWIIENASLLEELVERIEAEFAADIEVWLAAETVVQEAQNRPLSDEQVLDEQPPAPDSGEAASEGASHD